ncbi:putative 6-phosphogluconolactonase [Paraburkholderia tropica]|uniref:lactonase family protein n=1 Tax=Paraburkholderia tropica TaxID=92647 RepID=UPI001CB06DE1|nr:lactonase family protein [Paraburkholderia tropica]CAG9222481.1 putative 6-phosphogluconolactonase [Paraburkholderia tropica]
METNVNKDAGSTSLLAVGTYTLPMPHVEGKGEGIYLLNFDATTGRLSELAVQRAANPSYLTQSKDGRRLYAVREVNAEDGPGVSTYEVDAAGGSLKLLGDLATPGAWPCHVAVNEDLALLLASNYLSGEVLAYALDASGAPAGEPVVLERDGSGPNAARQEAPHAHCAVVSPDRRHVYLADLGVDGVVRHPLDGGAVMKTPDHLLKAAPGAGPRHLVFTASGSHLLANYELASTVRMYRLADNTAELVCEISSLPEDFSGESGAGGMRLHPSGKFVYVGNRGHDSIFGARIDEAAGTLTPIGTWSLGGRTPRDLAISPDGKHLLAAAQDDGFIRVFSIDAQTGALTDTGYTYPIPTAVCLEFIQGE